MAIFHLSIRTISRAKGHSAVAQIAYDTRCKLTNERTGEKHDWSKQKADLIEWQVIGPKMEPGELAARAEQAEKRWDARVGRSMDVALPHELNTSAQWDLLRGFGLQLRDTYGAGLCVSLHQPNTKGDHRNVHGHIFMTTRTVDEDGNFSKKKIRELDDRQLGPQEVEKIREMWEVRCNRALRKAGVTDGVTRRSLQAQGIERPAEKHLGAKASAMVRNGCRLRKAEINQLISSDSRRLAEIDSQIQYLQSHGHRKSQQQSVKSKIATSQKHQLATNRQPDRSFTLGQTHGVALSGKQGSASHGNRPPRNRPRPRSSHPNSAGELARFLAKRASITRIDPSYHFRGGQLLIGALHTLRLFIRILESEQQRQQQLENQRPGIRMKM
ncbi:MAG TPA: MobA/MobL family protein [Terrimicrobiaceae bacterium]|nr:MobA/MobL family protein [Terrimicrobiaceae bacterium]